MKIKEVRMERTRNREGFSAFSDNSLKQNRQTHSCFENQFLPSDKTKPHIHTVSNLSNQKVILLFFNLILFSCFFPFSVCMNSLFV